MKIIQITKEKKSKPPERMKVPEDMAQMGPTWAELAQIVVKDRIKVHPSLFTLHNT